MTVFTYGSGSATTASFTVDVTRYDESGAATADTVAGRTFTSLSGRLGNGNSTTADTLVMSGGDDLFAWDDYTTSAPGGALNGNGEYYAFQNSSRTRAVETILAGNGNDLVNLTYEASGQTYWQWDSANGGVNASMYVDGGAGDDIIWGHNPGERLFGGAGDDWIDGGTGNDSLYGGDDDDSLVGGGGNDTLSGDAGADVLRDTANNNLFYGGTGDDSMYGGAGNDTMYGGADDDFLTVTGGVNTLFGDDGNDLIIGGTGVDSAFGGVGTDYLSGAGGADYLDGGDDSDGIWGGAAADTVYGGAGTDYLYGGAGDGDTLHGGADADFYYFSRDDGLGDVIVETSGTGDTIVAFGSFATSGADWWVDGTGVTDGNGGLLGDALGGAGANVSITYGAGNTFTFSILDSVGGSTVLASISGDADFVTRIVLWNSDNVIPGQTQELFTWDGSAFVFAGYEG
ncbi:MAG: hypothetical protein IPK81_12635 [Rhodospirillales bacterium]|nr:MAG: hypothetical protein IPK81_12635 [Rhodospirillales bacterium]